MWVDSGTSSSTTYSSTTPVFYRTAIFAVQMELPNNGGRAVLQLTSEELERFKRGAAMLAGEFRQNIEEWDRKTPAERACYEQDADWVCERIEQCKLKAAGFTSSSGSGGARPTARSLLPST